jgi:hypothetical protein
MKQSKLKKEIFARNKRENAAYGKFLTIQAINIASRISDASSR